MPEATVERLTEYDINCPTTGEVCPALEHIVEIHTQSADAEAVMSSITTWDSPNHPRHDPVKLQARLIEHRQQARFRGCDGPEADACPVRQSMDESRIRQGMVATVRVALRHLRKLK